MPDEKSCESGSVNVVFEYNELAESYQGGRFIVVYPSTEEAEKARLECEAPGSKTRVVAIGISREEAQLMCHEALLDSGVIDRRLAAIKSDETMPDFMKQMEENNLIMAALLGGRES